LEQIKRNPASGWLTKAQRDLASARKLAADPDPLLDTAIFHCSEAAEKAITEFLVSKSKPFKKTHDLAALLRFAIPLESNFFPWPRKAAFLTSYFTTFRYPLGIGEPLEPSREEFAKALSVADSLYHFVLSLLPQEVHP